MKLPRLLVIGGGIAGASVAWHAARAGAQVTLLDAAEGQASQVPAALLNPVRGLGGSVSPQALAGLRETWRLVAELEAAGFPVPQGRRGLYRPVPDLATRQKWKAKFPPDLPHRWVAAESVPGLAAGWHSALFLPGGGWLDGGALVRALTQASGAEVLHGRALSWNDSGAELAGGARLHADVVVFCGGSRGADWADQAGASEHGASHRGGSLWLTGQAPAPLPLSFGAYVTPAHAGGVIGATFEAPTPHFNAGPPPDASLGWLRDRAGRLLGELPPVTGVWSGSRLSGLRCGRTAAGWWQLSGLGSRGFLLGPLLARHLVGDAVAGAGATGLD